MDGLSFGLQTGANQVRYLTVAEVAALMGVNRSTIQRWINQGVLTPDWRTPSGAARFSEGTVERFMKSLTENDEGG